MNFQKWFVATWLVMSGLILIARVGQTRRYTPADAVGAVIETGLLVWLVVIA